MDAITLSRVGGILGPFALIFGLVMNGIYNILDLVGIQNVALTIIMFTLISDILMLPLTIRQQKFTRVSALVQPEIQKIQKKYKGKTDELSQRRLQTETMEVYNRYGASPSSGCLPILITLPIMIALYRIIYNIPSYVNSIGNLFMQMAEPIHALGGTGEKLLNTVMEELSISGVSLDFADVNTIVDVLNNVKTTGWTTVAEIFGSHPEVVDAINGVKDTIIEINSMPGGLNVMDAPVNFGNGMAGIFPGILIPILAGLTQFLSIKITSGKQKNTTPEQDQMASTMKTMNVTMPLISVWICFTLPAGVGIYWISNALFRTIFSVMINKYYEGKDIEQLTAKQAEKIAEKNAKREAMLKEYEEKNPSKARYSTMSDIAKGNHAKKDYEPTYKTSNEPVNTGSISSVAHMLDRNKKED